MVKNTSCYDNKLIIGSGQGLETPQTRYNATVAVIVLTIGNYRDTARSYRFFIELNLPAGSCTLNTPVHALLYCAIVFACVVKNLEY